MTCIGDLIEEFKERPRAGEDLPVLTLTERNGFVLQSERFKKRLATEDISGYKRIGRNDIAFNPYLLWAGAVAQNTIVDAGVISPLYPTFRARSDMDARYVNHLLLSPRLILAYDGIAFGSVPRRRRSSVVDFLGLPVVTPPPLTEQRRIAAMLDQTAQLGQTASRAVALCTSAVEMRFRSAFGSQPSVATVESIAAPGKGAIRTGPFGSQLLHSEFTSDGVAVLGIDNVVTNEFGWRERRYISTEKYEQLKRYTVAPGDVLITIMGTCGRCVVVPDNIPLAINTKHLCAITVDERAVLPEFLRACFLWHPQARQYLTSHTKGAVMDGLNMGIIKSMPLPLPPMSEQISFLAAATAIVKQSEKLTQRGSRLVALSNTLQTRAFSGKL